MKRIFTQSQNGALERLFSSGVIRELARKGYSPLISQLLNESDLLSYIGDNNTLGSIYDKAFDILKSNNLRNEYIYKNAIAQKILLGKHSLNSSCMLTEFRAGNCKADVVILNGTSSVYEIKSERDTLDRLEKQLYEYSRVFDQIYVITNEKHVDILTRTIPIEVGILLLTNRYQISEYRSAISNIRNVSPEHIFESLQRVEYLSILQRNGITIPEVPNTRIHKIAKELFSTLTPEQAHAGMVDVLKQTRNPIALKDFIKTVPVSLKAVALSVILTNAERSSLIKTLNTNIKACIAERN